MKPGDGPTLYMICGKIAAGKSTLTQELAARPGTVRLSEDDWLAALYGEEISTLKDLARCSGKLRAMIGPHVVELLMTGVSVVLDFPANTPQSRAWMRDLINQSGAAHELHVLDVPDEVCLARLRARNALGEHPFAATEAQFREMSRYISMPGEDEGFNLVWHERIDGM